MMEIKSKAEAAIRAGISGRLDRAFPNPDAYRSQYLEARIKIPSEPPANLGRKTFSLKPREYLKMLRGLLLNLAALVEKFKSESWAAIDRAEAGRPQDDADIDTRKLFMAMVAPLKLQFEPKATEPLEDAVERAHFSPLRMEFIQITKGELFERIEVLSAYEWAAKALSDLKSEIKRMIWKHESATERLSVMIAGTKEGSPEAKALDRFSTYLDKYLMVCSYFAGGLCAAVKLVDRYTGESLAICKAAMKQ